MVGRSLATSYCTSNSNYYYYYYYYYYGYPDQLACTSTNLTGSEVNDHVNL